MTDGDITQLLNKCLNGDIQAEDELFKLIHSELRRRARSYMARENAGHSMGPTDLVHQAYLKLHHYQPERWTSRAHFYAIFSRAMRQILVDHARAKRTAKRGGGMQRIQLEDAGEVTDKYYQTLLDLDSLLEDLGQDNPEANIVFQLKHFGGLTTDQISEITGFSGKSVDRCWKYAEHWLNRALKLKYESK